MISRLRLVVRLAPRGCFPREMFYRSFMSLDRELFGGLSGGIYSRRPGRLRPWVLGNFPSGEIPPRSRLRILPPIVTIEVFGYLAIVNSLYQFFMGN